MSRVRPLSPYMEGKTVSSVAGQNTALLKYAAKKSPSELKAQMESPRIDSMDEETVTNMVPISKFKSSNLQKKEKESKVVGDVAGKMADLQMSPGAGSALRDVNFKNIDHPSMLSTLGGKKFELKDAPQSAPQQPNLKYCICGLPCPPASDICDSC